MNHLKNDHLYADSKREEAEEYVKKHPPTTRKHKYESLAVLVCLISLTNSTQKTKEEINIR